jgi:cytochrome oxidase assembly protein ShyY1
VLKTALKPRWILALLGALLVASGFVLLSQWQFNRSQTAAPPPVSTTESPVPLTGHIKPLEEMMGTQADQIVTASGRFLPGKQVLVRDRLQQGEKGFWVVAPFAVDGAPDGETIAVVRGWQADAAAPQAAPAGQLDLAGRLLAAGRIHDGPARRALHRPVDQPLGRAGLQRVRRRLRRRHRRRGRRRGRQHGPAPRVRRPPAAGTADQLAERVLRHRFLWYRLVADDYRRQQEDLEDAAAALRSAQVQETQQTIPEKEQA